MGSILTSLFEDFSDHSKEREERIELSPDDNTNLKDYTKLFKLPQYLESVKYIFFIFPIDDFSLHGNSL